MKFKYFLFILFWLAEATIGPGDKKSSKKEQKDTQIDFKSNQSVFERNFVLKDLKNVIEIVKYHRSYSNDIQKKFSNSILGYVTPWNSHGYEVCKIFAKKFSQISPVWLQIKKIKSKKYEFSGSHDIDENWMNVVKEKSESKVEFLPRILFEKWTPQDLYSLFNDEQEMQSLIKMLIKNSNKYKFSGYTLEIYIQLNGYSKPDINHFINDLANELHKIGKKLVLVVPPAVSSNGRPSKASHVVFSREDFNDLKDVVDGFSLMTYDFSSNSGKVGANAPLKWMRDNVEYLSDNNKYRKKILMGLNFYGIKYSLTGAQPEPIVGNSLIELFSNSKVEVKFDSTSEEHSFYVNGDDGRYLVFYPTLYSIHRRIELANELNVGLSIWELGQGLDYFYDLL
jgi:chitinase domain-containing protein 1